MPKQHTWKKAFCTVRTYSSSYGRRPIKRKIYTAATNKSSKVELFPPSTSFSAEPIQPSEPGCSYQERMSKERDSWSALREDLLNTYTEGAAPATSICSTCKKTCINIIVCLDCSENTYFCESCADVAHERLMFHVGKRWEVQ